MRINIYGKLHKGKSFYTLLVLLIAFIVIPVLAALIVSLNALQHAGIAEQATLSVALESQIQYSQTISPARGLSVQVRALKNEYVLLSKLGELNTLNYSPDVGRAEQLLTSLKAADPSDLRSWYLYFENSDYLMGTEKRAWMPATMPILSYSRQSKG